MGRPSESGQTLIEVAIMLPILILAIAESFWILHATVGRTECARTVFEATRSGLESGTPLAGLPNGVRLRKTENGMVGTKRCGSHLETQFLPDLGRRKPGAFQSPSS